MKILYITFIDFTINSSGSSVRPHKMYDGFISGGHEVFLVKGDDFITHDNREHKKSVAEANRWLNNNRPDICYVENSTHPLFRKDDRKLIKRIHQMGVPIGYFYRDAYYRFPKLYGPGKGLKNKLSYYYTLPLYYRDERFVRKFVDILYMPSPAACQWFSHPRKEALPPAGDSCIFKRVNSRVSLYIGGIAPRYGFADMLEAYRMLNKEGNYPLIVICRNFELAQWGKTANEFMQEYPWLTIAHASGKELDKYYEQAAVCIVPQKNDGYNDKAVSVKLYEYCSHSKPFIARPGSAMVELFKDSGAVIFTKDFSVQALTDSIKEFFSDENQINNMQKAACNFILNGNTWKDRADKVCRDLKELKIQR